MNSFPKTNLSSNNLNPKNNIQNPNLNINNRSASKNNHNNNELNIKNIQNGSQNLLNNNCYNDKSVIKTSEESEARVNNEADDWEYLKKTITKEGRYVSDDFIRYHQITDYLVDDEDNIINTHMNIIKVN